MSWYSFDISVNILYSEPLRCRSFLLFSSNCKENQTMGLQNNLLNSWGKQRCTALPRMEIYRLTLTITAQKVHRLCASLRELTGYLCLAPSLSLSSVQFSHSVMSDFATPWAAAHQASLSMTSSRSLLKLMSIELVMLFNHLILCIMDILCFPQD